MVEPPRIEYKGFKIRFNKKGDICRGIIVRHRYHIAGCDGMRTRFNANSVILLKKKQDLKSKYLYGPVSYLIKRKRFVSLFDVVL